MKIYTSKSGHAKGDTFRELLSMWIESGYCTTEESNDRFCWVGGVGEILLYEYARFDFMPEQWKYGLFSNMQMGDDNCSPWIFWARHPRKLEQSIEEGILTYSERETESIFLGKIENQIQYQNRMNFDWRMTLEEFNMPITMGNVHEYTYTQEEYLNKIKNSKFGLVLPGYGPKCNREIEYLGLGTVPVFTEGCSLDYFNSMEEGVHYLTAKNPVHLKEVIDSITEKQWEELSSNGREWYEKNCSREGSFKTTQKIVEELKCEH